MAMKKGEIPEARRGLGADLTSDLRVDRMTGKRPASRRKMEIPDTGKKEKKGKKNPASL